MFKKGYCLVPREQPDKALAECMTSVHTHNYAGILCVCAIHKHVFTTAVVKVYFPYSSFIVNFN